MVKEDLSAEEQVGRDARVEEQPAVILGGMFPGGSVKMPRAELAWVSEKGWYGERKSELR